MRRMRLLISILSALLQKINLEFSQPQETFLLNSFFPPSKNICWEVNCFTGYLVTGSSHQGVHVITGGSVCNHKITSSIFQSQFAAVTGGSCRLRIAGFAFPAPGAASALCKGPGLSLELPLLPPISLCSTNSMPSVPLFLSSSCRFSQ